MKITAEFWSKNKMILFALIFYLSERDPCMNKAFFWASYCHELQAIEWKHLAVLEVGADILSHIKSIEKEKITQLGMKPLRGNERCDYGGPCVLGRAVTVLLPENISVGSMSSMVLVVLQWGYNVISLHTHIAMVRLQ